MHWKFGEGSAAHTHGEQKKGIALLSPSVISPTATASPSQVSFAGRMHPQHNLWESRDNTASSIAFYAMLQLLKHKAQMVRLRDEGLEYTWKQLVGTGLGKV